MPLALLAACDMPTACLRLHACVRTHAACGTLGPRPHARRTPGAQNATTWLLPSELFPTAHRGGCHGAAAAAGKAGALLAGAWFGALPPARIFGLAAAANLGGAALTALFVPDVLGLDLAEGDARWAALAHQPPRVYAVRARRGRRGARRPQRALLRSGPGWPSARRGPGPVCLQQVAEHQPRASGS